LLFLQATGKKKATPGGSLDQALERMCKRTRELRGQVSQVFKPLSYSRTVPVFLPGDGKILIRTPIVPHVKVAETSCINLEINALSL